MTDLWLTIDDAPSTDCDNKREYLLSKNIPAVFFCTGQELSADPEPALRLIRSGFPVQNHSWSHPKFSRLSPDAVLEEIDRTEEVINRLYSEAGRPRPGPWFRFPFGDKGDEGGDRGKRTLYRKLLLDKGFRPPEIPGLVWPPQHQSDDPDWYWTFDVMEWSLVDGNGRYGIRTPEDVMNRLAGLDSVTGPVLMLIHDHDETAELFYRVIDSLLEKGFRFRPFT